MVFWGPTPAVRASSGRSRAKPCGPEILAVVTWAQHLEDGRSKEAPP